jgi:hypothetical protein
LEPLFSDWAAAWTTDPARVAVVYAANAVGDDFATGEHFEGTDAIRSHIETLHSILGDLKITLSSGFICGNQGALEYVVSGIYTSPQAAGNGQPVSFRIAALFGLADGKIVREAHYWNPSLPVPGTATPTS